MSSIIRYANRALAAFYVLWFVFLAGASIGEKSTAAVLTMGDAIKVIAVMAAGVWLGWLAGRESKEPTP